MNCHCTNSIKFLILNFLEKNDTLYRIEDLIEKIINKLLHINQRSSNISHRFYFKRMVFGAIMWLKERYALRFT